LRFILLLLPQHQSAEINDSNKVMACTHKIKKASKSIVFLFATK
jgi:hypothetical protein